LIGQSTIRGLKFCDTLVKNFRVTRTVSPVVLYALQHKKHQKSITDPEEFVNYIESEDTELKDFLKNQKLCSCVISLLQFVINKSVILNHL